MNANTTTHKVALTNAIVAGATAAASAPGRGYGCGRAYVVVYGLKGPAKAGFTKAAKSMGLMVCEHGIYMGYDNADGRALAKAAAFAAGLVADGYSAYDDAHAD